MAERDMTNNLGERMKRADWWYDYSDDGGVYSRGREEVEGIKNDLESLAKHDQAGARKLWEAHAPKEFYMPTFLAAQPMQEKALERLKQVEENMSKDIGQSQGFGF